MSNHNSSRTYLDNQALHPHQQLKLQLQWMYITNAVVQQLEQCHRLLEMLLHWSWEDTKILATRTRKWKSKKTNFESNENTKNILTCKTSRQLQSHQSHRDHRATAILLQTRAKVSRMRSTWVKGENSWATRYSTRCCPHQGHLPQVDNQSIQISQLSNSQTSLVSLTHRHKITW